MESHLDLCIVEFQPDGSVSSESLLDLLGSSDGVCFANAYDRDVRVDDWYYSFYHVPSGSPQQPNPVADIIRPEEHPPIRGAVLVVLNGPKEGSWGSDQKLRVEDVARTIWWYYRSGNAVKDIFVQRELRRFVRTVA